MWWIFTTVTHWWLVLPSKWHQVQHLSIYIIIYYVTFVADHWPITSPVPRTFRACNWCTEPMAKAPAASSSAAFISVSPEELRSHIDAAQSIFIRTGSSADISNVTERFGLADSTLHLILQGHREVSVSSYDATNQCYQIPSLQTRSGNASTAAKSMLENAT